jgi:hypothetical protein
MTPQDAAKALDLPADSTPEQIEARFLELRAKIEERIAKAPTPGLKDKYRESIADLTKAFEVLTIASDSTALPVLRKESGGGPARAGHSLGDGSSSRAASANSASAEIPQSAVSNPQSTTRKSGREYLVVAVIALVVLGVGGWWVASSRREAAEKARLEAAAKAEQDRLAAEAAWRAEEEKTRLATAAKSEQERLEKLALQLRPRLAELAIAVDAALKTETSAEREMSDLKAEERVLQREARGVATPDLKAAQALAAAHEKYLGWLRDHLAASPVRSSRARLEELAAAKAWDEVAGGIEVYAATIRELPAEIVARRKELLTLTGALSLSAEPAEVDFILTDTFGRTRPGRTPAELADVPFGEASVTFNRPGWPPQTLKAAVKRDAAASLKADLVGGALEITSEPFAVDFTLDGMGRRESGRTPAKFVELPVGDYQITYQRKGWPTQSAPARITRGGAAAAGAKFTPPGSLKVTSQPEGAEVWFDGQLVGATPLVLPELPPGPAKVELKRAEYRPVELSGAIEAGKELALTATLRSATLTAEEAFDKLSREGNGTWVHHGRNGLGGGATFYIRLVAGSKTLSFEMTGFGGSVRNLTMVDYDAENRIVLVMFGGLDVLNGKIGLRIDGDTLLWGKNQLSSPMVFRRQ